MSVSILEQADAIMRPDRAEGGRMQGDFVGCAQSFISDVAEALAKPRAWEGQRPRCPRFAAARATRTLPLPGFASVSAICEV